MNIISKVVLAMSVFIITTVATNISPAYAIQTFSKRMHKAVDNLKRRKLGGEFVLEKRMQSDANV